jgi:peptidoglycan/xylan/chitin deacetylase (PgdA/CDA1 family)
MPDSLRFFFIAFIIGIQGFYPLAVYADATNLIPNPSVESVNAAGTLPLSNTIPNPSVETIASGGNPADWTVGTYGTNNATFSVLNTGHTGSHSIETSIPSTGYQDGGAYWYYTPQSVIGGKHYLYTDWYQSNVETEVDATITMSDGTEGYYYLGSAIASPVGWNQMQGEIDVPDNVVSITIYHFLYSPGYLITDDFSFAQFTPTPFNRGLVSITFDDGFTDQYTKALPILTSLGLKATFYIISSEVDDQPLYMTAAQLIDLHNNGMEIGSHSVTHPDMTTLSPSDLTTEMTQSRDDLAALIGAPIPDFAYPEGPYNLNTITVGKMYYQSQRDSYIGFNIKDILKQPNGSYDFSQLKIQSVEDGVTLAQVKAWVDKAKSQKTWLILLYHRIENTNPAGDEYVTLTSDFNQEMQYIKSSGIGVVTVDQAIKEVNGQ